MSDQQTKPPKPNKQLFANSGLKELFTDGPGDGSSQGIPFFNQRDPNLAILHEKPEHRVLLLLKLRGLSNREIAKETGYSEPWLSQLFRQPWATATMAKISTESGVDAIRGLLQSEAIPSLLRLVELRDDPEAPKAVAKSACDSLLDRFLGKPSQPIDLTGNKAPATVEEVEELDQEIERLQEQTRQLVGSAN